jgi:hypothetical protein
MKGSKQRLYASLLIFGACVLLFRTSVLIFTGTLAVWQLWVSILLFIEMAIDFSCLITALSWWKSNDESRASVPLRFGAAAAIFHAVRVLVFVLGRTGPWIDFDVRPVYRAMHATRWSWAGVTFAAIMSILGLIGVIIIWRLRRRALKADS